jgi:hypothetical protein
MSDLKLIDAVAHFTGEDAHEIRRRGFVLAGPENSGLEPECLLDVLLVDLPETGTVDWDALSGDSPADGTSASVGRGGRIMRSNRRDWSGLMRPDRRGAEEPPIHAQGRIFLVNADRP